MLWPCSWHQFPWDLRSCSASLNFSKMGASLLFVDTWFLYVTDELTCKTAVAIVARENSVPTSNILDHCFQLFLVCLSCVLILQYKDDP